MEKVKKGLQSFGLARSIIAGFFILLLILGGVYNLNVTNLLSNAIGRWTMWGVLVLAMVPAIQCGIGPNFGITLGVEGGLLGALVAIELRYYGFFAYFDETNPALGMLVEALIAILLALLFAGVFGVLYGLLLNNVKGSEMTVATYVGFSIVALMNIMWLMLPFKNGTSVWPMSGDGLRAEINLSADFGGVFSNFGFTIGGVYIPLGMIIVIFLLCFVVWLFTRSRTGAMMAAAGANPNYAKASGINVNKMRIIGTAISTALGGVGIVCYAQSYGFLQLYNAPQMMGFNCVAAILIGGASIKKAKISHVIIGTFLFQGVLAVGVPVANAMIPGSDVSEILRMIISNGIILYALTKTVGGEG